MHVVRPAGAVMTDAELHRDPLARLLFPFIAGVFWGLGRDGEESGRRAAVLTASVVESIEEAVRKHGPVTERQLGEAAGRGRRSLLRGARPERRGSGADARRSAAGGESDATSVR